MNAAELKLPVITLKRQNFKLHLTIAKYINFRQYVLEIVIKSNSFD